MRRLTAPRRPPGALVLLAGAGVLACAAAATLLSGARQELCACGGPEFYDIDAPLAGPERWLDDVALADAFDGRPRDELRFLAPFFFADSARLAALWTSAYAPWEEPDSASAAAAAPDVRPLDAALRAGDLARAERAARAVVDRVLDMPSPIADAHQSALRRAVELLELAPALRGVDPALAARVLATDTNAAAAPNGLPNDVSTAAAALPPPLAAAVEVRRLVRAAAESLVTRRPDHPRAASLRWVAIQERLRAEIPDGWAADIRKRVPAPPWRALDDAHTRWLADYPDHPLADLVHLSRVRVAYFEGDSARAWRLTFAAWPRRLPRLLGEARVLALRGMVADPPAPAAQDPRVRSAMLTLREPSRAQWDALWQLADDSLPRPWAPNLQERLLYQAARWALAGEPLPARFPERPDRDGRLTPLWGQLRLVALWASGDVPGAEAQAILLGADSTAALVRTRVALLRGEWTRAIREPHLGADARAYLVRVLAPDSALATLAADRSAADSLRAAAALTLASRAVRQRGGSGAAWAAGAATLTRDGGAVASARLTRWRRAAVLAADTTLAGRLAYARWLAGERGALFFGTDNAWFRSMGWRLRALADTLADTADAGAARRRRDTAPVAAREEDAAIRAHLEASTEPYLALGAYADWLARAEARGVAPAERRRVAREADRVYNWLINWDATNTPFWAEALSQSAAARAIRRAGRG